MLLLSAGLIAAAVALPWVLAQLGRRFGTDDTPMGTITQKPEHTGHDDALRIRTQARRTRAEAIKRDGRMLDTRDDRASRIHMAGR